MNTSAIQHEIKSALSPLFDMSRGLIDPLSYMDYVIAVLFLKYVSDVNQDQIEHRDGNELITESIETQHLVVPAIANFRDLYEQRHQSGNGRRIDQALSALEKTNSELMGVFQGTRFNSTKLGNEAQSDEILRRLLDHFATPALDLRPSRIGSMSVIGDAYEYLIATFASRSGKHFSDFYTPNQVSELLAQLVRPQQGESIYDPACGSGSLLLRCARIVGDEASRRRCALYGQEKNVSTWALAKLNMFLRGENASHIKCGDSLRAPAFLNKSGGLQHFDVVVSNPPFSIEWASEGAENDPYGRFRRGVPPKTRGDYAFILHMIETLKAGTGRMAVVVPHGVLFRGAAEGDIRQKLVEENLLEAVIGLPPKLFLSTAIPVAILVFRKDKRDESAMFIDASRDFKANKIQNQLAMEHIKRLVDTYSARREVVKYARAVSIEEIRKHKYNLSIPLYIDTSEEEPEIDIVPLRVERMRLKVELAEVEEKMETYLTNLRRM
jgi:type I restriction enzyme M protein